MYYIIEGEKANFYSQLNLGMIRWHVRGPRLEI
uniref:Uncharacterized protein n=1 Tax=Anguilla anguilla TaxID=7936 RepID=A0A0E9VHI9_ANGAN